MTEGVQVAGIYVRDQDEALDFYVNKVGFQVHTDIKNGDFRWLTVQYPGQDLLQLGLFMPGPPMLDKATSSAMQANVAKGAMPALVLEVEDCASSYERMRAKGVEFIQEPIERFGTVDAGFRDPSGNGWKLIQSRQA